MAYRALKFCMRCVSRRFDVPTLRLYEMTGFSPVSVCRDRDTLLFFFKAFWQYHYIPRTFFTVQAEVVTQRAASRVLRGRFESELCLSLPTLRLFLYGASR